MKHAVFLLLLTTPNVCFAGEWVADFQARAEIVEPDHIYKTPYDLKDWQLFCCAHVDSENIYKGEQKYCVDLIQQEKINCTENEI